MYRLRNYFRLLLCLLIFTFHFFYVEGIEISIRPEVKNEMICLDLIEGDQKEFKLNYIEAFEEGTTQNGKVCTKVVLDSGDIIEISNSVSIIEQVLEDEAPYFIDGRNDCLINQYYVESYPGNSSRKYTVKCKNNTYRIYSSKEDEFIKAFYNILNKEIGSPIHNHSTIKKNELRIKNLKESLASILDNDQIMLNYFEEQGLFKMNFSSKQQVKLTITQALNKLATHNEDIRKHFIENHLLNYRITEITGYKNKSSLRNKAIARNSKTWKNLKKNWFKYLF